MYNQSTLFIVNSVDQSLEDITKTLPSHNTRVIKNSDEGKNEFQIAHAHKAIKEAYIATNEQKYIILCGDSFRIEAQNTLLKVLEEPPRNIIFLIITISKSSILPTILSRVQLKYLKTKKVIKPIDIDLTRLDLKDIYSFLKHHQRVSKYEAKEIIESLLLTIHTNNIQLTQNSLDTFSKAIKLIELNSRPINVLTTLLLNISVKKV